MTIKLKLSTGKEIELTKEEMEELKENFKEQIYITMPMENPIIQPSIPFYPNGYPIITCEAQ